MLASFCWMLPCVLIKTISEFLFKPRAECNRDCRRCTFRAVQRRTNSSNSHLVSQKLPDGQRYPSDGVGTNRCSCRAAKGSSRGYNARSRRRDRSSQRSPVDVGEQQNEKSKMRLEWRSRIAPVSVCAKTFRCRDETNLADTNELRKAAKARIVKPDGFRSRSDARVVTRRIGNAGCRATCSMEQSFERYARPKPRSAWQCPHHPRRCPPARHVHHAHVSCVSLSPVSDPTSCASRAAGNNAAGSFAAGCRQAPRPSPQGQCGQLGPVRPRPLMRS